MMELFQIRKQSAIDIIIYCACATIGILMLISCWNVVISPFPCEFREGHIYSTTDLMLQGKNPFSLDYYPEHYNSYGFLFNWIVYPFALLFGNSMWLHRLINEIFIFATIYFVVGYKQIRKLTVTRVIVLVSLFFLFNRGTISTLRPEGLGMFLFVSSIVIPWQNNYSKRSLIISGFLSILAFYTKSYFLIGWYLISAVILFKDWKTCIIYNVLYHIVFALSCIAVVQLYPLYFYETIFAYGSSIGSLLYSCKCYVTALCMGLPILILLFSNRKEVSLKRDWDKILVLFLITIILIFLLGTNPGAVTTYHRQLLMSIIAWLVVKNDANYNSRLRDVCNVLACIIICAWSFMLPYQFKQEAGDWYKLKDYVARYDHIYNSALIAPVLIDQNKDYTDNGVSGFVYEFSKSPVTEFLFGLDDEVLQKKEEYIDKIRTNSKDGYYDAIMLTDSESKDVYHLLDFSEYVEIDRLDLELNHFRNRKYILNVFVRK